MKNKYTIKFINSSIDGGVKEILVNFNDDEEAIQFIESRFSKDWESYEIYNNIGEMVFNSGLLLE